MRLRAFVFCVAAAATATAVFWPLLGGEATYTQFIAGTITIEGENKGVDYRALLLLVALATGLLWMFRALMQRIAAPSGSEAAALHLVGLALLPLALWFGAALGSASFPGFPYAWAIAALALTLLGAWRWRTSRAIEGDALAGLGEHALSSVLLSFFAGLALSLALFSVSGHRWPGSIADARAIATVIIAFDVAIVAFLFWRVREPARLLAALQRWLVIVQFALPLLLFVLLPAQVGHRGETQPYVWPWLLLAALASYAAFCWMRLTARLRRLHAAPPSVDEALEPSALGALAVFLTAPRSTFELLSAPGYPTLMGDDFHLGEQVLPWQQLVDFHRIPYVDFAPVHGLMPILTGALDGLFFDGTIANLNASFAIVVAVASVATILLASRRIGGVGTLALCFLLSPFDRLLFLAPALLLVTDPALRSRPAVWLAAWCAAIVWMLGYNAAIGSAFAAGTALLAVAVFLRAWRQGAATRRRIAAAAIIVVALVAAMPHAIAIVTGFFAFLVENGSTNTIGHGIPLSRGLGLPGTMPGTVMASRLIVELLRFSWIAVALYALQLASVRWRDSHGSSRIESTAALPLAIGLTLLVLSTWSIGRIDPATASRTGTVSFLAVGTLLPILYVATSGFPPHWARAAFAFLIALFAGMYTVQDRFSVPLLIARALPRIEVPPDLERVSGRDFGGARAGTVFVPTERAAAIAGFQHALSRVLSSGRTYFDFTNRQALYVYTGHAVPALYSATFNAVNRDQQRRILQQLTIAPPPAVFISPALEDDGMNASLRSFYLYRYFVRGYQPVAYGPYIFLVNEKSPGFDDVPDPATRESLLEQVFAHPDLRMLPAQWGASWAELQRSAALVGQLVAARVGDAPACGAPDRRGRTFEPWRRYGLPAEANATGRTDLIAIGLSADAAVPSALRIVYRSAPGSVQRMTQFEVKGRMLIVPMSSYPAWLRAGTTPDIDLCVPVGEPMARDAVAGVSAWSIPELAP